MVYHMDSLILQTWMVGRALAVPLIADAWPVVVLLMNPLLFGSRRPRRHTHVDRVSHRHPDRRGDTVDMSIKIGQKKS